MKITIDARLGCTPLTGDGFRVHIVAPRREIVDARKQASALATTLLGTLVAARRNLREADTDAALQRLVNGGQE